MAWILQIETSSKNCSVALSHQGETVCFFEEAHQNYSHSTDLHPQLQKLMESAPIALEELDAIAVGKGPGSYTGLRIGVSAAKGLAYALDIPLIGINSLTLISHAADVSGEGFLIPMMDARRMEVYTRVCDTQQQLVKDTQALVLEESSQFLDLNPEKPHYFFGDGSAKAKALLQNPNFHFLSTPLYPSAATMSVLAYTEFRQEKLESVAYFEPFYLKEFMTTPPKKKSY
ncbi:MAG: tRNA (adenosine(37)-N6)-threonylcarbamoyltransferase complex dimerization subunit type 1 TsaB [Flavobacteriaceae bacterium]